MIGKGFAGFAAALSFAVTATMAGAGGPMGMGGGGAGGIMSGAMSAGSMNRLMVTSRTFRRDLDGSFNGVGAAPNSLQNFPFPTNDPNHYHEIKIVGRLAKDESGFSIDRQIVRMHVDGREIPMSINGDAMSDSLQFDQGDELGQELYRLILSKRLEVVGDRNLRTQIANAAAANPSKPVVVDGFVYDRVTPYLVLVSVGDAQ